MPAATGYGQHYGSSPSIWGQLFQNYTSPLRWIRDLDKKAGQRFSEGQGGEWQPTAPPVSMGPFAPRPDTPMAPPPVHPSVAWMQDPEAYRPRYAVNPVDELNQQFGKTLPQNAAFNPAGAPFPQNNQAPFNPPGAPFPENFDPPGAPFPENNLAEAVRMARDDHRNASKAMRQRIAAAKAGERRERLRRGIRPPTLHDQGMGLGAMLNMGLMNAATFAPQAITNQLNNAFREQAQLNQEFGSRARDRESRERISRQAIEAISNLFGGGNQGGGGGGYTDTNSPLAVGGANNVTGNITAQPLDDQLIRNADQIVRTTPSQLQSYSLPNSQQQQGELDQRLTSRLRQLAPMLERNLTPQNQQLQQAIQVANAQQNLDLQSRVGLPMARNELAQLQTQLPMLLNLIQGIG